MGKMMTPVFYTFLTTLLIVLFLFYNQAVFAVEMKRYENLGIGVTLSYPSDWGDPSHNIEKGDQCSIFEEIRCMVDWFNLIDTSPLESWEFIIGVGSIENPDFSKWCSCSTLVDYMRHIYELAQSNAESFDKDFSFINDNETSVGKKNYTAWKMEISESSGTGFDKASQKQLYVFVKINSTFYEIRFDTAGSNDHYSKELPRVKEVIKSIEFSPVQKNISKVPSFMNASSLYLGR